MSDLSVAFAALGLLLGLLLARVPIAVALGGVSFGGIWLLLGLKPALNILVSIPYEFTASWTLSSVPMFLLMGYVCFHARLTDGLFQAARLWLSWLPGGLAVSSVGAAAAFSAVTGSSVACAAAIGRIAVPEMLASRYDKSLAAGVCAAAGTIGSLIPPSILMLLYGLFVDAPIGRLFMAGFLPGLLTAALYALMIIVRAKLSPGLAPATGVGASWRDRLAIIPQVGPTALLVIFVFAGLFSGFFTPTEAGAAGAGAALVIAACKSRLNLKTMWEALNETLVTTASIFIIAIGASLLTRFLALAGFTDHLSELVLAYELSQTELLIAVALVYLVLGCFLDPLGIMLLTLPIFMPLVEVAEIDLIWFGILVVKLLEVGLVTPPVGLNIFVIKGVLGDRIRTEQIYAGVLWFIAMDVVVLALIIAFPQVSLVLPDLLMD